jgi:hypothetical protein
MSLGPRKVARLEDRQRARDMSEAIHNSIMALVKAAPAGMLRVQRDALENLRAGDGLEIQVDSEGILLTYRNEHDPKPDAG